MTNDKAIYYLEQLKNSYTPFLIEEKTAINMAIFALEKQVGKKPQIVRNEFSRKDEDWNDYICPKCGRPFMSKINGEWFCGKRQNFCDLCGQRIDWSDEHGTD